MEKESISPRKKAGEGKRVLCVTGNPCVDCLVWHHGDRTEPSRVFTQVGGKGANVARMLSYLGCEAVHLMPWESRYDYLVAREPVRTVTVNVKSPMRVLPNYINMEKRSFFLDYANTNRVDAEEAELFMARFNALLDEEPELVIISGSACAGLESTYPRMVHAAKERGLPVILDSHGDGLTLSLCEHPDYIKPNREELEMVVGKVAAGEEVAAARRLLDMGARSVILTNGEEGSTYITRTEAEVYPPITVPTVNPVGCGDSFVTYFAYGLMTGLPVERCMHLGAAAGAVNAATGAIGRVKPNQVNRVLRRAKLAPMPEFA